MTKESQIDTSKTTEKKEDEKKDKKEEVLKDDKGAPLSNADIKLLKRYGKGPYHDALKKGEIEVKELNQRITNLIGIKESDTGLSMPSQWNLQ
jgi:26S proteasome regulatory subunit T1